MDRSRAFEVDQGFLIENGPFITGGASSPVGAIAAAAGDFYIQTLGTKPVFFFCTGTGVNDWRQMYASDALNILSLEMHTTTLNGTDTLDVDSVTIHVADGTATGYKFVLPDATTLVSGRRFEVVNNSSETILLNDDSGATLATLIAGDLATATIEDTGTAAGSWILNIVSSAATGISSYVLTSNTPFITSSTTDDLIIGFAVTPVQGRYAIWYSSDIIISNNNRTSEGVIYVAAAAETNTRRATQGIGSNFEGAHNTVGEINVNGSQIVDVRVNITAGALDVNQRSLVLIRLGS